MKSKIDKILDIVLISVLVGLLFEGIYFYSHRVKGIGPRKVTNNQESELSQEKPAQSGESSQTMPLQKVVLPGSFSMDIPFVCQAPLGNWNPPFDEDCEETAILMVHHYFTKKPIDPVKATQEIRDMINFEKKTYGFYKDSSAEQTAQLIRDYYGYKAKTYYNPSIEKIKKELVKGNPVIIPTAGRLLNNPYFTPPGPVYHMLVIKGYTRSGFIVNDSGTRRGANYVYSYKIIKNAMHDWNNGDVENGKPVMISVQK